MALDSRYVVAINLEEYLVDKDTGLPLANGTISFFEDDSRTTPKLVFQLSGAPPNYEYAALPNPMVLSGVGTTVNADGDYTPIYYYPYDEDGNIQLYYIVVKNELGVVQYTLQAWPNTTASSSSTESSTNLENQINNSQFVEVLFEQDLGLTISSSVALSAEEFQVAPDWSIIVSSTGACSVIINQIPLEGALNTPTNAPYYLDIAPSGAISSLKLVQRLAHNPSIFSTTTTQDGYVNGTMLIASLDGLAHTISMQYSESSGGSPQTIVSGSTGSSGYELISGTILLDNGENPQDANDGYVNISIVLPVVGHVAVTSVQLVQVENDTIQVGYSQETVNRQIDHLFHYYEPLLKFKPIKSYLTGWDFPLNPAQGANNGAINLGAYASDYLWDQTIGWQSVNSSLNAAKSTSGQLQITAAATSQFAIIQYLAVPEIYPLLRNFLSSTITLSTNQGSLKGTISLWYTSDSTLPNINTSHLSIIQTIGANGKPASMNGTWIEIERSGLGDAIFSFGSSPSLTTLEQFNFSEWELNAGTDVSAIHYVAVVVGFSTVTAGNKIVIESCSLVPGKVATIPAPQTVNEVLMDCQYYYEMSYATGVLPGTATDNNLRYAMQTLYYDQNTNQSAVFINDFSLIYAVSKIATPAFVSFYSPASGTIDAIEVYSVAGGAYPTPTGPFLNPRSITFANAFTVLNANENGISYIQLDPSAASLSFTGADANTFQTAGIRYHFTANARLGVY